MPGITWLGDIEKETSGGYLAKALGGGISTGLQTYVGMKEKGKERAFEEKKFGLQQSELDLKKKQIEHDYAKLDYDKRKDAYDSMVKLLPSVPPDKQRELTESVEWTTLEESLGLPHLSGTTLSPEATKPSWGQEQEVAAVKAALIQGRGTLSQMVGEPLPKDIKTKQDALDYISLKGLDPSLFTAELTRYEEAPTVAAKGKGRQTSPYKEYPDAYLDKGVWKVRRGGKVYKIEE